MGTIGFIKNENIYNTQQTKEKYIIEENFTHALILGETGSGKTTGIINPNLYYRVKRNHGILVYDFKGNYHFSVKYMAYKCKRLNDVLELGKPWGISINLLEVFNEVEFSDFLTVMLKHHPKDKFWEQSAINLGMGIYLALKALKNFDSSIEFTLKNLIDIASSYEKIEKLKIKLLSNIFMYYQDEDENTKKNILKLKKAYETIDRIAKDEDLENSKSEKTVLTSVVMSLIAPISNLAGIEYLNDEKGVNILNELSNGKIIILHVPSFRQNEINALTNAFFSNFQERNDNKETPITVFIDEAQKVLNSETHLPVDILREAKIEIILATQSVNNLIGAMGESKTYELLENLVTKIELKNKHNDLKKGFYQVNEKIFKLKPLYFSQNALNKVESYYQKKIIDIDKKLYINFDYRRKEGFFIYYPGKDYLIFNNYVKNKKIKVEYSYKLNDDYLKTIKNFLMQYFGQTAEEISDEEMETLDEIVTIH